MERALIILIGTVIAGGSGTATGGEDDAGPGATTVDSVKFPDALKSLMSSREELKSGMCRAKWKRTTQTCEQEGTWKFLFDYDKGLSRVDREVVTQVYASRATDGNEVRQLSRVKRIDTPLEMIGYVDGSTVWRQPPGDNAPANGQPFDLRTVGLIQWTSYHSRSATWQKWRDYIQREGPPAVSTEANGNLRLDWDHGVREVKTGTGTFYDSHRWVLWVDPARHFCPVRNEFWGGSGLTKEIQQELEQLTEAEWTETEGAMVPTRCHWSMPRHQQDAELTFEWESVNSSVPAIMFTPAGLGAPPGTYVVRILGEESEIEYIIGQPPKPVAVPRTLQKRPPR